MTISAFLLAVQAQASYSYGKHNMSMSTNPSALTSSAPSASLSSTSVFTPPFTIVFTTVPAQTDRPHVPIPPLPHNTFSWSFSEPKTHHMPTSGTVTHWHSHTHSHSHGTGTQGTPEPTVTGPVPHVSLSTEGSNIPEGTGTDNGDQPTPEGGLIPVPQVHPTTAMSHPHHTTRHSTAAPTTTEPPTTTESLTTFTVQAYTQTLSWTTITVQPATWTIPAPGSGPSSILVPPEGPPPPNVKIERAEDRTAAVMSRPFSSATSTTSSATSWATSSPFTLHCDSSACGTYCYCDQDGHVLCDYDPAQCANTCDCVPK
ncbi:hypothetical protein PG984_015965 [Apiospora sp. TS-2023a]